MGTIKIETRQLLGYDILDQSTLCSTSNPAVSEPSANVRFSCLFATPPPFDIFSYFCPFFTFSQIFLQALNFDINPTICTCATACISHVHEKNPLCFEESQNLRDFKRATFMQAKARSARLTERYFNINLAKK